MNTGSDRYAMSCVAPSTYYRYQQHRWHLDKRCQRERRDDILKAEIQRVYEENHCVYGVRKVWRQLLREGISVTRCTVAQLMKTMGLAGVLRGKKVRTTVSRKEAAARRPGEPPVRGTAARPTVGGRLYLRQHLAGVRLCGIHH